MATSMIICTPLYILGAIIFAISFNLSFTKFWHIISILLWPILIILAIFVAGDNN